TAQSQTAITRYYASELQALEGEIRIPTDGLATLQFYTVIGEVKAGDSSIFTTEPSSSGDALYLGSSLAKGNTDLVVDVRGKKLLFNLVIDESFQGPFTYIIDEARPLPRLEDPLNPRTVSEDLQKDVRLELLQATSVSDSESTVFFTFTNSSNQVVALDSARLVVTQNEDTLSARVTKNPLRQLVEPGETHSGFVVVKGAVAGSANLCWTAVEMQGNGREVTFNESIDIPR
ncbi:MAG: hypothetical protein ACRCYY_20305, partial [Trueperaceae bacterium]